MRSCSTGKVAGAGAKQRAMLSPTPCSGHHDDNELIDRAITETYERLAQRDGEQ